VVVASHGELQAAVVLTGLREIPQDSVSLPPITPLPSFYVVNPTPK
jgi:hypothetical protein